jgi:hypothetical protein
MVVDRQLLARTVGELRATLPQEGDLLVGLGRVVEATRTVVGVDGTGLTLAHEDGLPVGGGVGCGDGVAGADPAGLRGGALPGRLR